MLLGQFYNVSKADISDIPFFRDLAWDPLPEHPCPHLPLQLCRHGEEFFGVLPGCCDLSALLSTSANPLNFKQIQNISKWIKIYHIYQKDSKWYKMILQFFGDVFACGPKTVFVKRTFLGWGGLGWGWVACQRSLYFVHYSVLCCKDLWDRCYVTCFYAADGVGWGGGGDCLRSLYFVRYNCYAAEISGIVATFTCYYAADNGACVAAMTVTSQKKTRLNFFQVSKSSNQHGNFWTQCARQ